MGTAARPDPEFVVEKSESEASLFSETNIVQEPAVYRCGEPVPAPGTYWVWHRKHRPIHAAKVRFTVFPECAQCGKSVRFRPANAEKGLVSEWLRRDPDFRKSLARKPFHTPSAQNDEPEFAFPA